MADKPKKSVEQTSPPQHAQKIVKSLLNVPAAGVKHIVTGRAFPPLFVGFGHYFDISEEEGTITPSRREAPHFFTLDTSRAEGYASVDYFQVRKLNIDKFGYDWVTVRRHRSQAEAEGYFNGLWDAGFITSDGDDERSLHHTIGGEVYSITRRPPAYGAPPALLIYADALPQFPGKDHEALHIIWPSGEVSSSDSDIQVEITRHKDRRLPE